MISAILWYKGVIMINLGDAISLILTAPIFVVIMSCIFLNEKFTSKRLGATFLGFAGILLIAKPETLF